MVRYVDFVNSPDGLEERVLIRLDQEQRRQVRRELLVFSLVDALALGGLFASFIYLSSVLTQSGFGRYLSLIFSDNNLLAVYWQELAISLAESLPVLGLIAFLSVMIVSTWSISRTIINVRVLAT
jgi:hypothetical protein